MFSSISRQQSVSSTPSNIKVMRDSNSTSEQLLIKIPGSIVHLIESDRSVHLASGELTIVSLKQGDTIVAVFARVGNSGIRWPLAKDAASVKLDESHYFFTLRLPLNEDEIETDREVELLNYGVTIASKGQEGLLKELDKILETYSCFTVQEVKEEGNWVLVDQGNVAKEISPEELMTEEKKKELLEENSAAFWTVLAPNVEDYSGSVARMIAAGSGRLVKGIIWCGDVTVERLKRGNEFLSKKMGNKESDVQISPATVNRIKRVNMLTRKSEEMANATLSGILKVSGFVTSSIVNSYVGRKFFSSLPGQIVLASLDGFNKVCDAVEYAGRNVLSTSNVVTTGLVSQRFGEGAGKVTNEGLDAAGHAVGIAWAVFKIRKAVNPKSSIKPTTLVKAAAVANSTGIKAQ